MLPLTTFWQSFMINKKIQMERLSSWKQPESAAPNDPGIAFQLGLLYWRKNEAKKAQEEFKKAAHLSPTFSNALYMLGLSYDLMGQTEEAMAQFEKVAQLIQTMSKLLKF